MKTEKTLTELLAENDLLQHNLTDAKCSNAGYMSCFKSMQAEIKHLKWILETAVASEEKHYESIETMAGWIDDAKEAIDKKGTYPDPLKEENIALSNSNKELLSALEGYKIKLVEAHTETAISNAKKLSL